MHDFQFDGHIYRQLKGGAIGMDLTGVIADIYMCEWDRQLIELMKNEKCECLMYKRYKDDINIVIKEENEERLKNNDTMGYIKKLAESIDDCIKVKTDECKNYCDGRMPILDLKVWIQECKDKERRIVYCHYMKDVATRGVINSNSAHGEKMKMNVMVNEMRRIIRNCSVNLEWEEKAEHLTYFMRRLQFSGYSEKFRFEAVRRALGNGNGGKKKDRKRGRKDKKKHDWYMDNGKYESVMFVDATPGEKLKKEVEKVVKKNKMKIKIVEKAGRNIKGILQKSDPFPIRRCGRDDCVVCANGMNIDCRTRGCVYEIECTEQDCGRKYIGTTGRSLYERMKEHMKCMVSEDESDSVNPIYRHRIDSHSGREFPFVVRILDKQFGKPSKRLISEAVRIERMDNRRAMNNKNEWSYVCLNRTSVQRND